MKLTGQIVVNQTRENVFTETTKPEYIAQWIHLQKIEKKYTRVSLSRKQAEEALSPTTVFPGKIEALTGLPLHLGSTFHYIADMWSPSRIYKIEITEYEAPHLLSFKIRSHQEPFSYHRITLHLTEQGTEIQYTFMTKVGWLVALAAPLWIPFTNKYLVKHMNMLKKQLEIEA